MADTHRPEMSDAEREVLKVLWDHGPLPVREVLARLDERGQDWTRSTAVTLLQRLEKKGYVESDRSRHAFVFRPLVSREDVMHARMADLASDFCDGEPLPLVLAFAERHRFSPAELARFRQMIEQLEAKRRKRGQ
jgi:BlaI family transcriptional regulator, penicillinase repressor